jgi:drug/metabolite transporter (DMT)-like permease
MLRASPRKRGRPANMGHMMDWFVLSLLTAFATATQDALVKKWLSETSSYEMALFPMIYSLPVFLLALLWIPVPSLDSTFWGSFLACLPFDAVALLLYMEAIRIAPLSLTLPYLAFTPVFILITGSLVLDEMPDLVGVMGILLTVVGGYILNSRSEDSDFLAPIRNILRERGSWMMCIVAFLYAFASVFGRQAVLHSSPIFFASLYYTVLTVGLTIILTALGKAFPRTLVRGYKRGILVGLILFAHAVLHNSAMALTKASYMISVKRLNVLFGVLYGGILFRESHMARRLVGAALMVAGAVMISLWGD